MASLHTYVQKIASAKMVGLAWGTQNPAGLATTYNLDSGVLKMQDLWDVSISPSHFSGQQVSPVPNP